MPSHLLANFEKQKYIEPIVNGVYARNNISEIKDGVYVINLDEQKSIGAHWIALYVNGDNGVEYIPKEI